MRAAAILTGPPTHLDHLGILSAQLEIPLIVTDEKTYALAKQYYPDFNVHLIEMADLTMEFLADRFDALFESGKFWAAEMGPFMELLFRKKMRFIFCPHGTSDKGHSLHTHTEQDISLVYGDQLLDLLHRTGAANKIRHLIRTGNYRYPYYLKHRSFYKPLIAPLFPSGIPTILYAPTWHSGENPTSFFQAADALIQELTPSYNLILKLHPFLEEDYPAQVFSILCRYENHPRVHFLTDFPPIYPLLAQCDLYLGDYSSIGYDFLAFDKPLYFLHPKPSATPSPLEQCGFTIPLTGLKHIKTFLTQTREESQIKFEIHRKNTYLYAFGSEIESDQIKKEIFETIKTNKPD